MLINKPFIERVIELRAMKNDHPIKFAVRNKASPIEVFSEPQAYNENDFIKVYKPDIDAVRLFFSFTEYTINGRHRSI